MRTWGSKSGAAECQAQGGLTSGSRRIRPLDSLPWLFSHGPGLPFCVDRRWAWTLLLKLESRYTMILITSLEHKSGWTRVGVFQELPEVWIMVLDY